MTTTPTQPLRLLTNQIGKGIDSFLLILLLLLPHLVTHFTYMENELSMLGGPYICSKNLTAADVIMSFPIEVAVKRMFKGNEREFLLLVGYVERLKARERWKKAVGRVREVPWGGWI